MRGAGARARAQLGRNFRRNSLSRRPPLRASRPLGILWIAFYCLANIILLNLMLAVVYNAYSGGLKRRIFNFFRQRARGLRVAYYELLRGQKLAGGRADGVEKERVKELVVELNKSCVTPFLPLSHFDFFFDVLDNDRSGTIDLDEFCELCDNICAQYMHLDKRGWFEAKFPAAFAKWRGPKVKAVLQSDGWATFILWVMGLNGVCVLLESYQDLSNCSTATPSCSPPLPSFDTWALIEFAFASIYALELVARCVFTPIVAYWKESLENKLSVDSSILLFSVSLAYVFGDLDAQYVKFANLLRLLGLLRVLLSSNFLRRVVSALRHMLHAAMPNVVLFFVTTSLFIVCGVQLYGGQVYAGNAKLAGSEMFAGGSDVLNFNDQLMGYLLFMGVVVSGGPLNDVVDGLSRVSGQPFVWPALFFMVCIGFEQRGSGAQLSPTPHRPAPPAAGVLLRRARDLLQRLHRLRHRVVPPLLHERGGAGRRRRRRRGGAQGGAAARAAKGRGGGRWRGEVDGAEAAGDGGEGRGTRIPAAHVGRRARRRRPRPVGGRDQRQVSGLFAARVRGDSDGGGVPHDVCGGAAEGFG